MAFPSVESGIRTLSSCSCLAGASMALFKDDARFRPIFDQPVREHYWPAKPLSEVHKNPTASQRELATPREASAVLVDPD